jgi:hypothetical protein
MRHIHIELVLRSGAAAAAAAVRKRILGGLAALQTALPTGDRVVYVI